MRRAWWRDRREAVRALRPVLSPPPGSEQQDASEVGGEAPPEEAVPVAPGALRGVDPWGGAGSQDGCVRVWGEPRQGTATLAWGCDPQCAVCGAVAAGTLTVVAADAGWCVASLCGCEHPFYTRESRAYGSEAAAAAALAAGDYEPE